MYSFAKYPTLLLGTATVDVLPSHEHRKTLGALQVENWGRNLAAEDQVNTDRCRQSAYERKYIEGTLQPR